MADPYRRADPRAFAWEALERIEAGGFSDAVVGAGLDESRLAGADRALATLLVYGTLTWQGLLDHILAPFTRRPLANLDPHVRILLRLGLFQICKLDRVPDFAAVNTSVELCKARDRRSAGFVNAVLRRAAAQWRQVRLPSATERPAEHLAVRLSHPLWLVERWLEAFGPAATEALLEVNNQVAPTVARVNRQRTDRDALLRRWRTASVEARPTRYAEAGIELAGDAGAQRLPGFVEGDFALQGEASQLVAALVGAVAGERVLDLCAAPGGKTCALAESMANRGSLVAVDLAATGIERIAAEARRLGLTIIEPIVADGTQWSPGVGGAFDRVLVDAPCSGFGTLRQHPEIRWRRCPADVTRNAALQRRLLQHAATLVRPGGTLVYATCTLAPEENDEVVAALCAGGGFRLEPAAPHLGPRGGEVTDAAGHLRTLPHRHGMDGFFAARLLRCGADIRVRA